MEFETKGVIDVNADKDSVEEISMEGMLEPLMLMLMKQI